MTEEKKYGDFSVVCKEVTEMQNIECDHNLQKEVATYSEGEKSNGMLSETEQIDEVLNAIDLYESELTEDYGEKSGKTKILNENITNVSSRFVNYDSIEIEKFIQDKENKNTLRKTLYDVNLFKSFLQSKNEVREFHTISHTELDVYLANFILSVRKKGGKSLNPHHFEY